MLQPGFEPGVRPLVGREFGRYSTGAGWPRLERVIGQWDGQDSNLGRTYASGSEPLLVDHLSTATER